MKILLLMAFSIALLTQLAVASVPQTENQQEQIVTPQTRNLADKELFAVVEFSGNIAFSSEELEAALFSGHKMLNFGPFKVGKELLFLPEGTENLKEHLERVRFFLGKKGYLRARIGELKIEDLSEGVIKVLVPIEEGACYRIGRITVKGSQTITSAEIIETSGLRYGEPINAAAIQEKIFKDIKDKYADKGNIQASVDFVPEFKLPDPTVAEGLIDVTIEIDEGRLFTIESIEFLGLTKTGEWLLRDLLLVREGQPYSRQKLNETLKRLNQLGIFEEVKDKDVTVRTSDRGALVKIGFQIKELSSQR
ncbi:MAG: POTRA domain-containing protein [Acidobacteriota bacterium]